jgi:hypothetical protein
MVQHGGAPARQVAERLGDGRLGMMGDVQDEVAVRVVPPSSALVGVDVERPARRVGGDAVNDRGYAVDDQGRSGKRAGGFGADRLEHRRGTAEPEHVCWSGAKMRVVTHEPVVHEPLVGPQPGQLSEDMVKVDDALGRSG